MATSLIVADFAVDREVGALRSIEDIYTATPAAKTAVTNKVQQWELYRAGLKGQIVGFARLRAAQLSPAPSRTTRATKPLAEPALTPVQKKYDAIVPCLDGAVKGREFALNSYEKYAAYMKANPDALKKTGLTPQQATSVVNYVNGRRSVLKIRNSLVGESGREVTLDSVAAYLDILKAVGWVNYGAGTN